MKFIQYYLECLSHASYLIGDESTGRAVVVDPQRDIAEYMADAAAGGFTIELVIETHFHADFLSGHLELADATGARIVYSSVAQTEFESWVWMMVSGTAWVRWCWSSVTRRGIRRSRCRWWCSSMPMMWCRWGC